MDSDAPPAEPPGNLLVNGSFETWGDAGPFGWDLLQSGMNERFETEGAAAHGKIAAAVTCFHPDEFVYMSQTVPVAKPGIYKATLYVKTIMMLKESHLLVETLGEDGKRIGAELKPIKGQVGEWRTVAGDIVVPKSAAAVRYQIRIGPQARGQVAVDFARLELVRAAK